MAVLTVPRALQDRLGGDAAESLVELLRQIEDDQEQRRALQKEHLFEILDERVLRHIAESEERLRKEIGDVRTNLGKEIGDVRKDLGKEIGDVRKDLGKEIGDVRKEITVQTRWIVAVLAAASVLIPIMQRVMATLLP